MHKFNYGFLKNEYLPSSVVRYLLDIGSVSREETHRLGEYPKNFERLRLKAAVASVKASNAIEHIVTTDRRITELVNGAMPQTHDEEEIAGYSVALNEVHTGYEKLPFSEKTIRRLHETMYSKSNRLIGGMYKAEDNLILQYDARGNASVRFRPVPAEDCQFCMNQLVLAYTDARQNGIPDLVLIPCVILDFLCIHPFSDGNGRVSRLLSLLLYYRAGFDIGKYISIENEILENRDYYYEALHESSKGWNENENNYVPFINFCMYILSSCYIKLNRLFLDSAGNRGSKALRIESLIEKTLVPVSKEEICRQLPDISTATVQSTLSRLLKEGKIVKTGTYRNARYSRGGAQN